MTSKVTTLDAIAEEVFRSGQTILVGGFGRGGTPFTVLEFLAGRAGALGDLTLVKNDANEPDLGIGMLIKRGMVRRLISTHIGLNPEAVAMMNEGKLEIEFVPQGIFAERLRCGGAGIPAFLTDVGIDTVVAKDKPRTTLDGREYLLERALHGDVALLCADRVDESGNCWWRGSNRNMSVPMGTAAKYVLVEAREIVPVGAIEPENVHLPGIFVDGVVKAQARQHILQGRH